MEGYLRAEVWEQTGKSETHLSHFEKWFPTSSSRLKNKSKKQKCNQNSEKGVKIRAGTAQTPGVQLVQDVWIHLVDPRGVPMNRYTSCSHAAAP